MADFATPNLPSRDFTATEAFYRELGFERLFRADYWLILRREEAWLEFFPHRELDPAKNWASCCLRLDDLGAMVERIKAAGVRANGPRGIPRLVPPRCEPSGVTIAYLVDPDGNLMRLVQQRDRPTGRGVDQRQRAADRKN